MLHGWTGRGRPVARNRADRNRAAGLLSCVCLLLFGAAGCSLLYDGGDHQGGGGVDGGGTDQAVDAAARCAADPDEDDDGHDAIVCGGGDCDDNDNAVFPGAPEVCGNNRDESCGGSSGLQQLLGVSASVAQHPARLLLSVSPPRFESLENFIAPTSLASTPGGGGWFVAATLQHDGTQNTEVLVRATADAPTSFSQVANNVAPAPDFANLVGLAVARDRNGGGDPAMTLVALHRQPRSAPRSGGLHHVQPVHHLHRPGEGADLDRRHHQSV